MLRPLFLPFAAPIGKQGAGGKKFPVSPWPSSHILLNDSAKKGAETLQFAGAPPPYLEAVVS